MKIYTKTGDDGTTGLLGNVRVKKNVIRIEAYGTVDELNACLGLALAHWPSAAQSARPWLTLIQNDLLAAGSVLATPAGQASKVNVSPDRTIALEQQIDAMDKDLKPLKHFILPEGTPAAATLHWARAVCRRAERRILTLSEKESVDPPLLIYFNRLSDFLFVLARWVNLKEGHSETTWIPAGAGSPSPADSKPDPLAESLKKIEEDKQRRKSLFEQTAAELEKKKVKAQESFQQSVDQVKKEGKVEKPPSPFDLD